jgi:hypothetical protein
MRERCRELWLVQCHMRGQLVDVGAKRRQLPQFLHHLASDQESIVAHESGADFPAILLGGPVMSELLPVSIKKGRGLCLACLRRTCRVPVQASGHVTMV